jgi:hypothetical protein
MSLGSPVGGTLGSFNVGLSAALAAGILPLSAQLDALLSIGLGPFMAELSLQFNASLAAQATLTLQIGDPTLALQLALSALAQLQAALAAALQFPPITLSLSAELTAAIALGAALAARLGMIKIAIEIALRIKLGVLKLAANLQASLDAGPAWAFTFEDGGGETLQAIGSQLQALFAAGVGTGGDKIEPTDNNVYGVVLMTKVPVVQAALSAIITV